MENHPNGKRLATASLALLLALGLGSCQTAKHRRELTKIQLESLRQNVAEQEAQIKKLDRLVLQVDSMLENQEGQ